jgi:SAM-dependent MidA family methyltransferase
VSAAELLAARIRREGSITFDAFMECALYDAEHGFFAQGRGAGRGGRDFLTSPEVGELFGMCVARAIDRTWEALGRPDPFLVVEPGAGAGRLASQVRRAQPACLTALRYVLIERSPVLRAEQRGRLPIEPADETLGPFARRDPDEEPAPVRAAGPVFASLADIPEMPVDTFVLANELLDNLPFGIAEWDGERWHEIRVTPAATGFAEVAVPAAPADAAALELAAGTSTLRRGARLPIPRGLDAWFDECGRALRSGVLTVVDYVVTIEEMLGRGRSWLRTYRGHGRGSDPLEEPGAQDITADVAREHLARAATAAGFTIVHDRTQAEWLRDLGVDELAAEGRRAWDTGAARGDLEALAGRSLVGEAAALTDPSGLGAHRVVTLHKGSATAPHQHR